MRQHCGQLRRSNTLTRDELWAMWQPMIQPQAEQARSSPACAEVRTATGHREQVRRRVPPPPPHSRLQVQGHKVAADSVGAARRVAHRVAPSREWLWYRSSWQTHAAPNVESLALYGSDDQGRLLRETRQERESRAFTSGEIKAPSCAALFSPSASSTLYAHWHPSYPDAGPQGGAHETYNTDPGAKLPDGSSWATDLLPSQHGAIATALLLDAPKPQSHRRAPKLLRHRRSQCSSAPPAAPPPQCRYGPRNLPRSHEAWA